MILFLFYVEILNAGMCYKLFGCIYIKVLGQIKNVLWKCIS